ncbi:hypothetical protein [Domibacillus mangrovi]|uniref:Uncharacterized protein n=1 Tax=Domibacillus mangrovi TaxID=1714354 RepID=A0A1Q5P4H7_9BACI|nr:hypothetical protein [Domibacillus mangrovi]OKL37002.1 hypothetical protein BLL40_05265 [Domibacillus mangrovi]
MRETHHHTFSTVDYEWTEQNVLFVKVNGFDAGRGKEFEGVVKFIEGVPFGDLIHVQKSSLSTSCRGALRAYLLNRYHNKDFN